MRHSCFVISSPQFTFLSRATLRRGRRADASGRRFDEGVGKLKPEIEWFPAGDCFFGRYARFDNHNGTVMVS